MKTALRKDKTSRPRGKSKRASKSVNKAASETDLGAALRLYAEFSRDKVRIKPRIKINSNDNTEVNTKGNIKVSEASGSGNQNSQYTPLKISICPVKRSVSAIEMGM